MNLSKIAKRVHFVLEKSGHKWNIGGELRTPSVEDVEKVVDSLYTAVYNEVEGTDAQLGGVRITRNGTHYDVYVYVGELNDEVST